MIMVKLIADNYMHPNESPSNNFIEEIYSKINGHDLEKVLFGLIMSKKSYADIFSKIIKK
jgi:hypothetical protein